MLIDRATAYSTILVNLASDEKLVQFKIYSYANDAVYPVQETLTMQTGSVYGSAENPVVLNGTFNIVLTPPQVNLVSHQNTYRLTWNAVPNANNYRIYSCSEPTELFVWCTQLQIYIGKFPLPNKNVSSRL